MNPEVLDLWRRAEAVCFDVDSTVSPDEGIDVLAAHAGKGDAVAELTRRAMAGDVPFDVALTERLELIRPTRQMLEACLKASPPRLTPGIDKLVAALRARNASIHLISGGFEPMILPLARRLGIPDDRVHANSINFAANGSYAGFDANRPTARSGGKGLVIASLKRKLAYDPVVMIGDGATDLAARPPADAFIGYGGVVTRDAVRAGADWFVTDFQELIDALA